MKNTERVATYTSNTRPLPASRSERMERAREERRRKRQELLDKRVKEAERQAEMRSPKRRRYVIVSTAAVLFVTAFVVRTGWNLWKLQAEKLEAQEALRILQEERAELEDKLKQVESDEYVEHEARSELHMIKPGEVLYIIPEDAEGGKTDEANPSGEESGEGAAPADAKP